MLGSADIIRPFQHILGQHNLSSLPAVVLATAFIANGRVKEVNRKLVLATEPTACLDSLLPLPAAFPYHTAVMHPDFNDAEETVVGPCTQGKQRR